MGGNHHQSTPSLSARALLEKLFNEDLVAPERYDPEVFDIVKQHLGKGPPHSKAGNNLASALVELAIQRTKASDK